MKSEEVSESGGLPSESHSMAAKQNLDAIMEALLGCVKSDEVPELPDASDSASESSQSD